MWFGVTPFPLLLLLLLIGLLAVPSCDKSCHICGDVRKLVGGTVLVLELGHMDPLRHAERLFRSCLREAMIHSLEHPFHVSVTRRGIPT
jgi:hypothetical protein